MMHRPRRRDDNESDIVWALRRAGALVYAVSEKDLPDLLVGFRGRWVLMEVKGEAGPKGGTRHKHRDLRPGQEKFFADADHAKLPTYVVRSVREALGALGIEVTQ